MYMGIYNDDKKQSIISKLQDGIALYMERYEGLRPVSILINEGELALFIKEYAQLSSAQAEIFKGISIESRTHISKHNYWVGWVTR